MLITRARHVQVAHHDLHLFHHLDGVHHWSLETGSHAVQRHVLSFGDMQIYINFFVKVKLFDFFTGLSSHETSHGTFFVGEIDETH